MLDGRKILAVIPARGGSKGVLKKNLKPLFGKPLIGWSIEAAKGSKYIDEVIVSSDDGETIATAERLGCHAPFVRPAELATDEAGANGVIVHALQTYGAPNGFSIVVVLQPTSPLRTGSDIDSALESMLKLRSENLVSVVEVTKTVGWASKIDPEGKLAPLFGSESFLANRQALEKFYVPNGAIYICTDAFLLKRQAIISADSNAFIMPAERSLDIDSELDFALAEVILKAR